MKRPPRMTIIRLHGPPPTPEAEPPLSFSPVSPITGVSGSATDWLPPPPDRLRLLSSLVKAGIATDFWGDSVAFPRRGIRIPSTMLLWNVPEAESPMLRDGSLQSSLSDVIASRIRLRGWLDSQQGIRVFDDPVPDRLPPPPLT